MSWIIHYCSMSSALNAFSDEMQHITTIEPPATFTETPTTINIAVIIFAVANEFDRHE